MQQLTKSLHDLLGGNVALAAGYALVALLLVQGLVLLYVSLRRVYLDHEQRHATRERLQLLVKAAAMQCREVEQARLLWNGYRKFQVAKKVRECDGVSSLYLAPHD